MEDLDPRTRGSGMIVAKFRSRLMPSVQVSCDGVLTGWDKISRD